MADTREGLPLARLPTETHGDGDSSGDATSDVAESLPSHAPTNASRFPGDLDDDEKEDGEIIYKPNWSESSAQQPFLSVGKWADDTSGAVEKGENAPEGDFHGGHGGTYGLLSANWGGKWSDPNLTRHMHDDIKNSPCQLLCVQEASEATRLEMMTPVQPGPDHSAIGHERSPFMSVRGAEPSTSSLMISARQSLVLGIRVLVFHRILDGQYTLNKGKKKKETKRALSRILMASLKMRFASAVAETGERVRASMKSGSLMCTCTSGRRSESCKAAATPTRPFGIPWPSTWLSSAPPFSAATSTWRCSV